MGVTYFYAVGLGDAEDVYCVDSDEETEILPGRRSYEDWNGKTRDLYWKSDIGSIGDLAEVLIQHRNELGDKWEEMVIRGEVAPDVSSVGFEGKNILARCLDRYELTKLQGRISLRREQMFDKSVDAVKE